MPSPDPAQPFIGALADLAARIAAADAAGAPVPEEARQMLVRLRELTEALHGFGASLAAETAPEPSPADPGAGAEG